MIRFQSIHARHVLGLGDVQLPLAGRGLVVVSGAPGSGRSSIGRAIRAALTGTDLPTNALIAEPNPTVDLEIIIDETLEHLSMAGPRRWGPTVALCILDLDVAANTPGDAVDRDTFESALGVDRWSRATQRAGDALRMLEVELGTVKYNIERSRPPGLPQVLDNRINLRAELNQATEEKDLAQADVVDRENAIRSLDVRLQRVREEIQSLEEAERIALEAIAAAAARAELLAEIENYEARLSDDARSLEFPAESRQVTLRLSEAQAHAELPQRALAVAEGGVCPACLRPMTEDETTTLRGEVEKLALDVRLWDSRAEMARWSSALLDRIADLRRRLGPEIVEPPPADLERIRELREVEAAFLEERATHTQAIEKTHEDLVAALAKFTETEARWQMAQQSDISDTARAAELLGWKIAEWKLLARHRILDVAYQQIFPELARAALERGMAALNQRLVAWLPTLLPMAMRCVLRQDEVQCDIRDENGTKISWGDLSATSRRAAALVRHLALWDIACDAQTGTDLLVVDGSWGDLDITKALSLLQAVSSRERTIAVVASAAAAPARWVVERVAGVTVIREESPLLSD